MTQTRQILLFAALRERAGGDRVAVDVASEATVRDLLEAIARQHPALADGLASCRVALDHEFVSGSAVVGAAREIALIPPVSGGASPPALLLADATLSRDAAVGAVRHAGAGAILTFEGLVRGTSRGRTVRHLEYEAYGPMAERAMQLIAEDLEAEHAGVRVAIHHRTGQLAVGETAVVIAVSSEHRAEGFAACRAAIERLKRDVPIWKREVYEDGAEWLGQGP